MKNDVTYYLYKITNKLNGKSYIGITNNSDKRFRQHCCLSIAKAKKSPISLSIQKYGKENFKFDVICMGSKDYILDLEVKSIKEYNTQVPNGYNISSGGEINSGWKWSEESVNNITGLNHSRSQLSEKDLIFIIERDDLTSKKVANILGVNRTVVENIRRGDTYTNFPRPKDKDYKKGFRNSFKKISGENCINAKLTQNQVNDIVWNFELSNMAAANKYNVSPSLILKIRKGVSWPYIKRPKNPIYKDDRQHEARKRSSLTEQSVLEILKSSKSYDFLAKKYNCSDTTIYNVKKGKVWREIYLNFINNTKED